MAFWQTVWPLTLKSTERHGHFLNSTCDIRFRDWSLITGRWGGGALQNGRGHVKFYPYEKGGGGAEKVLAILKGGGGQKKFRGSFYAVV